MTDQSYTEPGLPPVTFPRRWLLRLLTGTAAGAVMLVGLAACGGEDEEDEEDD